MDSQIKKLVNVSGSCLSNNPVVLDVPKHVPTKLSSELRKLLELKNGFYAFEQALHVLPSKSVAESCGLDSWNDPSLWISNYKGLADGCFFFAEDVFGGQFCIRSDGIYTFDPETGALTQIATSLSGWAKALLENYDVLAGYNLAHKWQVEHGRLDPGMRLAPKQPFVLQGEFVVENLYPIEAVALMRQSANLAVQIRDLPDGAQVTWKISD
ncbi:SMI1/KNR4 family protein [Asticcacaulis sp. 201]|uniref:SMI1/KNR4 family protein n=1 Tax=Asticcacaulis sp. 201 TaxID=3028787 RepID=UPI002916D25F|nr:SMI1/KNR4 family protein [Asticcacaulis sp. 201]MDV6333225.1 SMI1/KNR4 family protein [Asticcacaulis sp. 201]